MKILFLRFPYESRRGGAENQTRWLMEGLKSRGHSVSFLGSCPILFKLAGEIGLSAGALDIGFPPVTKWLALSFLWRKKEMQKKLIPAVFSRSPEAIFMLSLSEKILLTEEAAKQSIKVFWIEHDRVGPWLSWNPWLPALRRAALHATIVCVSELSRQKYIELGFEPARVVAIPNGVPEPPPSSPNPFSRREKGKEETVEKKAMNPKILEFARDMRKSPTKAEEVLWEALRDRKIGFKFRRQHPFQHWILDFYAEEISLGIELDGAVHDQKEQAQYDREREEVLEEWGIHIIRFRNEEVMDDLERVLQVIKNTAKFSPLPSGEGPGVRVGCISRLSPEKGIDVLLLALAKHADIDLTILGTGRDEGYIRTLIAQDQERVGAARIKLVPAIRDLEEFYASIDALVLPSSDHDPFGLVVAEAMMRGVPVVVTDACGIAGYLRDGEDALIAKAGSVESLSTCLNRLKDGNLRSVIAAGGHRKAHEAFSLESMVSLYEGLLRS